MLRQWIRRLTLCSCVLVAGCGVSATGTGVTTEFAKDARAAHAYMTSDLIPAIGTARFPTAYTASRARVKLVQSKVAGDVDQGVWLLLTMVNVKSSELNGARELAATMNLSSQAMRTMREGAQDVATERDSCLSEANAWLNGRSTPLHMQMLNQGPCLQTARLAYSVLTKK
jgi:hypothetical protein